MSAAQRSVLIVVDAQNDFVEGGSLASVGAARVCRNIANYLRVNARNYSAIVLSKDWHITPENHFVTWPEHCMAGTKGAEFFWPIQEWFDSIAERESHYEDGSPTYVSHVSQVYKGQYDDGYSAWDATTSEQVSTRQIVSTTVSAGRVYSEGVHLTIDVCGLVTEHCVRATVLDALTYKLHGDSSTPVLDALTHATGDSSTTVQLLENLTVANNSRAAVDALAEMTEAGAKMVHG